MLTGKKFLTDQQRLKPRKIPLPNSLNDSPSTSICLITPEPQRVFKDTIAHPSFPSSLSQRITKVISIEKLEKKYHSFESKRQLRDSYDIFLADDRIITYLAKILGKTFYKTTPKRPIPVHLEASKPKEKKNAALPSTKLRKEPSDLKSIAAPLQVAKDIERTLSTAQIHLSPSTTTSVKVGYSSFTAEQLAANVEAVIAGLTDKLVAWRNIRAVHVKGQNTMALPIWLAEELWTDEGMILEDEQVEAAKLLKAQKGKRKRKALEGPLEGAIEAPAEVKKRKGIDGITEDGHSGKKKAKKMADGDLSQEMKERREKLRQQKSEAREKLDQANVGVTPAIMAQDPKKQSKKERRADKRVEVK